MTNNKLTDELYLDAGRLSDIAAGEVVCEGEAEEMARRLLAAEAELQERRRQTQGVAVRYLNKFSGVCVTLEQQPNAATDLAVYQPLYSAAPQQESE